MVDQIKFRTSQSRINHNKMEQDKYEEIINEEIQFLIMKSIDYKHGKSFNKRIEELKKLISPTTVEGKKE